VVVCRRIDERGADVDARRQFVESVLQPESQPGAAAADCCCVRSPHPHCRHHILLLHRNTQVALTSNKLDAQRYPHRIWGVSQYIFIYVTYTSKKIRKNNLTVQRTIYSRVVWGDSKGAIPSKFLAVTKLSESRKILFLSENCRPEMLWG